MSGPEVYRDPDDGAVRVRYSTDPIVLARQAAEAIRQLNHVTYDTGAYGGPQQVREVVDALRTALDRIPQALVQAGSAMQRMVDTGRLYTDDDTPAGQHFADASFAMGEAAGSLGNVARSLQSAGSDLWHLGMNLDPEEESDDAADGA